MIIGDRSQFQDDTYDGFISSGLVHLIAVSGGNLVMIIVFLSAILFRVPLYIRTVIIMGAIISYALIVGADSSIIRAVIMALLIMTALLAGRTTDIRRLMMIASLLMLRRNPYYLRHDIGFVFSYMALIGIILTTQWSARRARLHPMTAHRLIHRPVSHYIIPTIGASLGVMPALLFFTGSFSILSLLGNIIVLPVVPLVMIGGAISLALGYYRDITWPARLIDQLLQYIMTISEWIAHTSPQLLLADQWFGWLLLGRLVSYIIIHHHPKTDPDTSNLLHRP
jgi:competence protein ComEC